MRATTWDLRFTGVTGRKPGGNDDKSPYDINVVKSTS